MVERLMNTLKKIPFEAYVVGGAVRDAWLGIEPKDIDICSPLDVIEMKGAMLLSTLKFQSVTAFPTIPCSSVGTSRMS